MYLLCNRFLLHYTRTQLPRPTDRRTRSDSVNPEERALACHAARSTSLARIFTHTSRPAPRMCRCRWGGQRGHSPPPAPAGDPRSVAPKGRLFPDI